MTISVTHEFYQRIPRTSMASREYHICQHGVDTRWYQGPGGFDEAPCHRCEALRMLGIRDATWRYPKFH